MFKQSLLEKEKNSDIIYVKNVTDVQMCPDKGAVFYGLPEGEALPV